MLFRVSNGNQELEIDDDGGQIMGWKVFNHFNSKYEDIFYQGHTKNRTGIPILFPFANPLENDIFKGSGQTIPQHGFARNTNWTLSKIEDGKQIELNLTHRSISKAMRLAFPFKFDLSLVCDISEANTLSYTLQIKNTGQKDLPISPGIHPYFPVINSDKTKVSIAEIPDFQANSINWDKPMTGTFFDFNGKATIDLVDRKIVIDTTSSDFEYRHLVVWSQNTIEKDYNFICFEPFSRETNSININPILIKSNEIIESSIIFRLL